VSRFVFCISLLLLSFPSWGGEIEGVKVEERGDYVRVMFFLRNMPRYSVSQEGGIVRLRFKNSGGSTPDDFLEALSFLDILRKAKIQSDLNNRGNDLEFSIFLEQTGGLKRHLYTKPDSGSRFFRVIIDMYGTKEKFVAIDDFIAEKVNFSEKNSTETKSKSIGEIIADSIRANSIEDLFALNNILDDAKITEDLEQQNNSGVDLHDFLGEIAKKGEKGIKVHSSRKNASKVVPPARHSRQFVLVIDAGHGGRDSGALGRTGTKEKDINLKFAKILESELRKIKRVEVYLTRSSDRYLSLSGRIKKARNLGANLLISVHSDSNINKNIKGLTVYTLTRMASDVRSVNYLREHNMTVTRTIENYRGKFDIFSTMLDISRYNNLNESNRFAKILSRNFVSSGNVNTLPIPHKYGNFAILLAPEFPSVLIELGFLSNADDERLLKTESYRHNLARQIARSVVDYISIN
jgi:N-acetylmuramoyl-L-alanine amidase